MNTYGENIDQGIESIPNIPSTPKWNVHEIVVDHEDWIAVNKPFGMATIHERSSTESLHSVLEKKYGKLWIVHRLDKDTSGLLLFAKNEHAHRTLSLLFQERKIEKTYIGITQGSPLQIEGEINQAILPKKTDGSVMEINPRGKKAITQYKVIEDFGMMTIIHFFPLTGRTHQIRVHAQSIGHSLLCDPLYGNGKPILISDIKQKYHLAKYASEQPIISRLALHSFALEFTYNKVVYKIEAPLLKDMRALIAQLRKQKA